MRIKALLTLRHDTYPFKFFPNNYCNSSTNRQSLVFGTTSSLSPWRCHTFSQRWCLHTVGPGLRWVPIALSYVDGSQYHHFSQTAALHTFPETCTEASPPLYPDVPRSPLLRLRVRYFPGIDHRLRTMIDAAADHGGTVIVLKNLNREYRDSIW
jgi:hypothetical protein